MVGYRNCNEICRISAGSDQMYSVSRDRPLFKCSKRSTLTAFIPKVVRKGHPRDGIKSPCWFSSATTVESRHGFSIPTVDHSFLPLSPHIHNRIENDTCQKAGERGHW